MSKDGAQIYKMSNNENFLIFQALFILKLKNRNIFESHMTYSIEENIKLTKKKNWPIFYVGYM